MLEIQFADAKRQQELNCLQCPERVKSLRRCQEDRWDFTSKDANFWPMRVSKGGDLFGFCPAKATWDSRAIAIYNALIIAVECGTQWQSGGIADQPSWWVELLSWFAPTYNELRFTSRARSILGDGKGADNGARKRIT